MWHRGGEGGEKGSWIKTLRCYFKHFDLIDKQPNSWAVRYEKDILAKSTVCNGERRGGRRDWGLGEAYAGTLATQGHSARWGPQ